MKFLINAFFIIVFGIGLSTATSGLCYLAGVGDDAAHWGFLTTFFVYLFAWFFIDRIDVKLVTHKYVFQNWSVEYKRLH